MDTNDMVGWLEFANAKKNIYRETRVIIYILYMDRHTAYRVLEISAEPKSLEEVKRYYRVKALQLHPDKNSRPDSVERFQEVQEAYEYLVKQERLWEGTNEDEDEGVDEEEITGDDLPPYRKCLFSFLKEIFRREFSSLPASSAPLFYVILRRISCVCEEKAMQTLENLDRKTLLKIYEIMEKYQDVLHFTGDFIQKVKMKIGERIAADECIVLNPTIDDLLENRLYKLTVNQQQYIVPLWHHELVYDNKDRDVFVRCMPVLDENVEIDENNNVHVWVAFPFSQLWENEVVEVKLGERMTFPLNTRLLKLAKLQTIMFSNQGIPRMDLKSVYNVSKKGHVFIHLEIVV